MTPRRRITAAALGIGILLAGVVGFGLVTRPPAPASVVDIESLEQAVGVGLLDPEVLAELRATGEARAIVHLNVAAIIDPIRRAIGEDRTAALIDAMTAAFKANKATLAATFGADIELVRDFERLGAIVVTIRSEAALLAALRSQLVREITTDRLYAPTAAGSPDARPRLGLAAPSVFEGAGMAVGVLDTGVDDASYPEYFPAGSVAGRLEAAPEDGVADSLGHGTHVASTVLLMAPQARIYSADVFRLVRVPGYAALQERAFQTDTLAGMDWLIGLRQSGVDIRAVNLSLGAGHYPPSICTDDNHFAEAYTAGIIPVVSAGNSAFADDDDKPTTVFQPGLSGNACNETTLSVGAVTSGTCADGLVDTVAYFSQSGEALDLLAPGTCVVAAGGAKDGTSMAAPHVAGAVAALASARPAASAYEIWAALINVGPVITDPNSRIARHRLDIPAAVDALLGATTPLPTPAPAELRGVAVGVSTLSPPGALRPGEQFEFDPIGVRNVGTVDATYAVTVESGPGGFVTPAPASWFSAAPSQLELGAGSLGEVRLAVRPSDDAEAGVYAAVLRVADASGDPAAVQVVDVSFVVFDSDEQGLGGGGITTPEGSPDDVDELLDNPVVIIVGIVVVLGLLRLVFGGRRRGAVPPPPGPAPG